MFDVLVLASGWPIKIEFVIENVNIVLKVYLVDLRGNSRYHVAIDPWQKWLPLNYSFVRIQNSLTNLARDNKFFRIFVSKTRLVRLFNLNMNKIII